MKTSFLLYFIALLISFHSFAQTANDIIPFDKQVKTGKLANGLTYYIRHNKKPEKKAELRLVVNAGSILERDDQQGIAHFLEHMAFNGTKHFPKNELLSYLQKAGVRFGADLNATTNFDFTMYMLPIPSNDDSILNTGFQVLRDWAGGLLLEQEEIDKERNIILEEKRMRQDAGQRTFAQYLPFMVNNSKYGQRLPIGKEEIIKTAPRKVFADFYRDWYRPNNMSIIAVGDIDVSETETAIKLLFSDLKNPVNAPVRPLLTAVNWHTSTKANITSDAENTNNALTIYLGLERITAQNTWASYSNNLINEIITSLFDGRLRENIVNAKSPVSYGNINLKGTFVKGYQTASIFALVKDNVATAITLMVGEVIKAKEFGFTQTELDRVKKSFLKKYEEALLEKDKTESASYVFEYVDHFLNKTPSPGIEAEHKFITQFINALTLEQVNSKLNQFDINKPSFILLNCKEAFKNSSSETELITAFEKAKVQKTEAYTEKKVSSGLMEVMPIPGKIIKTEENNNLGSTAYTLSNGITVISKKTNFKNDEIILRGSQWGGLTNLDAGEIKISKYFSLASSLGLGKNKAVDMPKIMMGAEARVLINPGPYQLVISGNASVKDFEMMLQLFYLKMTDVNFDAEEFEGIKANFASQMGNLLKNPAIKFADTLTKVKFNNSSRMFGFPTEEEAKNIQLNDLKTLYIKLTGNLNGAVLVFTGNIDESIFRQLVERYIASIPTGPQPVALNKSNIVPPVTGINTFMFKAGKENKAEINYSYYGKVNETDNKDIQSFILMGEMLQMKANQKLREEMGSTYAPQVSNLIVRPPVADFNISLTVSALPENTDRIMNAFDELINQIIRGDVSEEDLQKAKAQRMKVVETFFKTNNYWSSILEQQFSYNFTAINSSAYLKLIEEITKEDIISVAKKYLLNANKLKAVMNPE